MISDVQVTVEQWVKEILKKLSYEKITCQFPNYDTGGGYLGEIIFVTVTAELNNRKTDLDLIVKKSKDNELVHEQLGFNRGYLNEINFYSTILPRLQTFAEGKGVAGFKNIPRCYGTLVKNNNYVILLENLKKQNYKVHDFGKTMDLSHVKVVIEAYAKWHALNLAFADQHPEEFDTLATFNQSFIDTGIFRSVVVSIRNEIEKVAKIYVSKNLHDVARKLLHLGDGFEDLFEMSTKYDKSVIRHGDCWNNNYLFHYSERKTQPSDVVVIDWQLAIAASPLLDISQFLFYCCSKNELDHLDELLDFYYNILSEKMEKLGSDPERCYPKSSAVDYFKKFCPIYVAGMLPNVKMSCLEETPCYDISEAAQNGNVDRLTDGKIRNQKEYFDRLDGIISFCIQRGFL